MFTLTRPCLKAALFASTMFPLAALADIVTLSATLSAANQNGSDPALVTDPLGVIPTDAFGAITVTLDTESFTLDYNLDVTGISSDQLRNFGPNATPIHLHIGGGGKPGNFGPIAVDLTLGATDTDFTDTATGFTLSRNDISILLEDQGNVQLGMHPGNDRIVDVLQSGNAFVLVHTLKDIFVNDTGPVPGFPFGEIRGNITRDPAAVKSAPAIGMDSFVLKDAVDVPSAVADLKAKLEARGFTIPIVIPHSGVAANVGLELAPNQVIYARPPKRLEKKLLSRSGTIGIDLPLKFHVFEQGGMVKLSVNSLGYLIDRHELKIRDVVMMMTDKLIEQFGTVGDEGMGLATIESTLSFDETVQAVQDAVAANPVPLVIPLVLDYGEGNSGKHRSHHGHRSDRAPVLILFGSPVVGTPLMQADPRIGIDLPLRILVWQDRHGVKVSYSDPRFLGGRVNLQGFDGRLNNMANALERIATAGAGR